MEKKQHQSAINQMGSTVLIVGIVAGIVLGFVFQSQTLEKTSLYSSSYEVVKSFNWTLCISVALSAVVFAILLYALGHIAAAIEDTTCHRVASEEINELSKKKPAPAESITCIVCGARNSSNSYTCKECGSGLR